MVELITGDAPCGQCDKIISNIPLVLSSKESDGEGGFWYNVSAKGVVCLGCGEPMKFFHQPAPVDIAKELFSTISLPVNPLENIK